MRWVMIMVAALVLGLGLSWQRSAMIQQGQEIDRLSKQRDRLLEVRRKLEIELATLYSLRRIEEVATRQLGMVRPGAHQVVVVEEPAFDPGSKQGPSLRLARGMDGSRPMRR